MDREALQNEATAAPKDASKYSRQEQRQVEHTSKLQQIVFEMLPQVADSTAAQSFGKGQAYVRALTYPMRRNAVRLN